jgi:hypothetical protein
VKCLEEMEQDRSVAAAGEQAVVWDGDLAEVEAQGAVAVAG